MPGPSTGGTTLSPRRTMVLLLAALSCAQADLYSYVQTPDSSYAYTVVDEVELPAGTAFNVELISQTWRDHEWKHWVSVMRPKEPRFPDAVALVINGGRNGRGAPNLKGETGFLLSIMADKLGCAVALLSQVPNQPMFDNLREDALIALTFDEFLKSGEEDWPLLLPMTKSAVRSMDMLQELLGERFGEEPQRFCVTGGSKRGWTTWLTAACDKRVVAIAPMVFDTLNMQPQMRHQIESWGDFSKQIEDYTNRNLPQRMSDEPRADELRALVDPFAHLQNIEVPKYIIIGTNDRYWPVDAARFYFDELIGESYLHYLPNAGHGLERAVVDTIACFFNQVLGHEPRPRFAWQVREGGSDLQLNLICQDSPQEVRLWTAHSETRDFRDAQWSSEVLEADGKGFYSGRVARPEEPGSHVAFFAESIYEQDGRELRLATRVEVHGLIID